MIIWHGVPSNEVPVVVEHRPGRKIPRRKMSVISIPGSNRDILISQDAYEPITQTYEIHIPPNRPRLDVAIRNVTDWLCVTGYPCASLRFFFEKLFPDMLLKTGAQFSVPTGDYIQSLGPEQKITDCGI